MCTAWIPVGGADEKHRESWQGVYKPNVMKGVCVYYITWDDLGMAGCPLYCCSSSLLPPLFGESMESELLNLWNRVSEDQSVFSMHILKPKNIYAKIEKYFWNKSLLVLIFWIGVVRKNDFFCTYFCYRPLILYWICTHRCIPNELTGRRLTGIWDLKW